MYYDINDYKKSIISTSINRIFIEIIFVFSFFIVPTSSFAQSDSSNNSTNQTMKKYNSISRSNSWWPSLQQAANQNSGNASDGDDSNITEKVKNIGKNLTEGAKNSLKQLIKNERLAK